MSKIKIENVPVVDGRVREGRLQTADLVAALKELSVGQSFVAKRIDNQHRVIIQACELWSGHVFKCQSLSDGTRVGRVK